jgi:hypothetical protein
VADTKMLAGKCECGATRYRVENAFLYAANCHCSNCRASTGSAFKPFAGIERDKLEVVEGADTLLVWGEPDANHTRCGICGSLLYSVVASGARRARRARVARRRAVDPADRAHLRRLEGALVRDHGRPAAVRGVLTPPRPRGTFSVGGRADRTPALHRARGVRGRPARHACARRGDRLPRRRAPRPLRARARGGARAARRGRARSDRPPRRLDADLEAIAAEARTLGYDRVALAWTDPAGSPEEARATVARVADAEGRADALGLRYGYHNHWHELEPLDDGTTVLDLLAELPVWLELDLGWVWWAGADPVELLERFRGRTPLVHVKDLRARGSREYCPVGDGGVGYERVVPAADVEWLVVEQDEHDGDALEAVARSYAAVTSYLGVAA